MAVFRGFVLYQDVWNRWHWALYTPAGRKIAESGCGYDNRPEAIEAARRLAGVAQQARDEVIDVPRRVWVI